MMATTMAQTTSTFHATRHIIRIRAGRKNTALFDSASIAFLSKSKSALTSYR